jgi:hypothetical protein
MRTKSNTDLETEGCLLCGDNFVSKSEPSSFDEGEPAWKAGTLPTELLPQSEAILDKDYPLVKRWRLSGHRRSFVSFGIMEDCLT